MAGEKILIVEDESIVALDLRKSLAEMGYQVAATAASAAEALDLAREHKPNLVLMDIQLKGAVDGVEAAVLLRERHQVPVIFLTAFATPETIGRAKRADPMAVLHKPLDHRELRSAIDVALYKHRLDQRLRESESRYRRLVDSVTDYIYTVRIENGRAAGTRHGPACVAVTGYSLEEYEADPDLWFKMVHPADREAVLEQTRRVLTGQAVPPLEHRLLHKDGRVLWVRSTQVPHCDQNGRLLSYDGLVSNITERKQAEEKLKEHARKLEIINRVIGTVNRAENLSILLGPVLTAAQELISFAGGAIYLIPERSTTPELVCQQGAAASGWTWAPTISNSEMPPRPLFVAGAPPTAGPPGAGFPELPPGAAGAAARVPLVSKDRVVGAMVLADGRPHVFSREEKSLLQSIGRQLGAALAKLRSENALRESEEMFRIVSMQSLAGIQIIKDGRLIFVNDGWCGIFGYGREEVLAWQPDEFFQVAHPDDREFFREQMRRKQEGATAGVVPVYDFRIRARDGAVKWVLLHSNAVLFADGRAVVGVLVDITARKQAEQALAEANRRLQASEERLLAANRELSAANRDKETLLREVNHRVKNNLQVVSSLFNLQLEHIADATAAAAIRECQNRIKSIAMVHEKLCQSHNLAEIDLGEYIRSLVNHLVRTFRTAPDAVRLRLQLEPVALDIDQAIPCCLIVNELATNALKHAFPSGAGGEIGIVLRREPAPPGGSGEDTCLLTVGDNGAGLPPGLDFRQADSLGMQLVLTFVEQLGGAISLDNSAGAVFAVRFVIRRQPREVRT